MKTYDKNRYKELLRNPAIRDARGNLPASERLKLLRPFSPARYALKKVLSLDAPVRKAALENGIPVSLLQAVLFREQIAIGVEDLLDHLRKNASRGLCQIKPDTALRADRVLGLPVISSKEVRTALRDPDKNLTYCARILRSEAFLCGADPARPTDGEICHILKVYNGSSAYADRTLQIQKAFASVDS